MKTQHEVMGYLPSETPTPGKMILFAFQQVLVMFPATVTVALLTGFHVSTTIFASGLATLAFLFVTKGKIPLYYGSSFSYIAAIAGMTGSVAMGQLASDDLISKAQFGIICSGFISIFAGIIVNKFGMEKMEKILPATVTGPIAMIIGLSLATTAINGAGYDGITGMQSSRAWVAAIITLVATIVFSVYLKGLLGQIPILLGIIVGYVASVALGLVDFSGIISGQIISLPHFTLPQPNLAAVIAIAPIALATIPESSAHLYQLDIYVNDLAKEKNAPPVDIASQLGTNLIGDGIADMVSALFGGPAGTNYGENISTMAITKNFSVKMLASSAVLAMLLSFFTPLSNAINTVPSSVINGACIFLFGVIAAQGIAIMVEKKVDLFDAKNLAVIAVILIVGLGGHYLSADNMLYAFGLKLPPIATSAIVGIVLNAGLSLGDKALASK